MAKEKKHLKIASTLWNPWSKMTDLPDGSVKLSGITGDIIDIIASAMNFTYTVEKPLDGEWGRELPNGSFTGLIGQCQRKEVDMALGPLSISWNRFQVVDFSRLIVFDEFKILVPRPLREVDFTELTRPLAWQVWITLAIMIAMGIVFIFATNYLKSHGTTKHNQQKVEVMKVSWITRVMLAETVNPLPKNNAGRIFILSWMIAGLIFHVSYSGVLTSLLAVPKVTVPVDSLQDLVSYGKFSWIYVIGTLLHDTLVKGGREVYKDILDRGTPVINFHYEKKKLKRDRIVAIVPITTMTKFLHDEYSIHGTCEFYIAKDPVIAMPLAFAFPKGSNLTEPVDKWLDILKESGIIMDRIVSAAKNATACLVPPGKEKGENSGRHTPFTVIDLAGIFLLYGVGVSIGFIVLLLECIVQSLQ